MEQPYQNRCLLVSFGPDSSAANVSTFMGALQEASWLDLTDLETLRASEPYMSGDDAAAVADTTTVDPAVYDTATLNTTLTTLAHTRRDLQHFNTSVLLADGSMPGDSAAQAGDANNTKPGNGDANDTGDANDNATSDDSGDVLGALNGATAGCRPTMSSRCCHSMRTPHVPARSRSPHRPWSTICAKASALPTPPM